MTYFIRCASDCLEVNFMPLACDSILHCSVVQVVTSGVGSTSFSRSLPAQHHVVTDPLLQGHTGGRAWDSCRKTRLSLAQQNIQMLAVLHLLPKQRINAHSLLERAQDLLCIFIVGHQHIKVWWPEIELLCDLNTKSCYFKHILHFIEQCKVKIITSQHFHVVQTLQTNSQ